VAGPFPLLIANVPVSISGSDTMGDPVFAKSCFIREKGPQKDPKKNHQIKEGCAHEGFEIHRQKCVGILSRRKYRAQVGEIEEKACGTFAGYGRDKL
jgi:hypothetical protein